MTYARSIFVPPGSPGTYHCVSRCVRRGAKPGRGQDGDSQGTNRIGRGHLRLPAICTRKYLHKPDLDISLLI